MPETHRQHRHAPIVVIDDFDRADGGLGPRWKTVAGNGSPQIISGCVYPEVIGKDSYAYVIHRDWHPDQWAMVRMRTRVGAFGKAAGPIVRAAKAANQMYLFHAEGVIGEFTTVLEIRKCLDGTYTTLATTGPVWPVHTGDQLYLEIRGTSLVAKINGVTVLTSRDSSISRGSPGIGVFSDTGEVTDAALDGFVAGTF